MKEVKEKNENSFGFSDLFFVACFIMVVLSFFSTPDDKIGLMLYAILNLQCAQYFKE